MVLLDLKFNEVNKIIKFSLRGFMLSPVIKMLYFKLFTGHFLTPLLLFCVSLQTDIDYTIEKSFFRSKSSVTFHVLSFPNFLKGSVGREDDSDSYI